MVSGRATALTAASPLSQCADTTRIASGLPRVLPNPVRNSRARLVSIGKVGAPWETKTAGKRSAITPAHPFRDEHGLGRPLALHDDIPDHLHSAFDRLELLQLEARPQARAHPYRRGETQAVESIVDAHLRLAELQRHIEEVAQQGQRQKTVRDRHAERRFTARAFDIDVDPLMVSGGFGKAVDALLRNFQPVADHDFLADLAGQLLETAEYCTRHPMLLLRRSSPAMYRNQWACALREAIRPRTMATRGFTTEATNADRHGGPRAHGREHDAAHGTQRSASGRFRPEPGGARRARTGKPRHRTHGTQGAGGGATGPARGVGHAAFRRDHRTGPADPVDIARQRRRAGGRR